MGSGMLTVLLAFQAHGLQLGSERLQRAEDPPLSTDTQARFGRQLQVEVTSVTSEPNTHYHEFDVRSQVLRRLTRERKKQLLDGARAESDKEWAAQLHLWDLQIPKPVEGNVTYDDVWPWEYLPKDGEWKQLHDSGFPGTFPNEMPTLSAGRSTLSDSGARGWLLGDRITMQEPPAIHIRT
mmetsp:Transcript_110987/g.312923  ORF Transcript_110987/g.312923 Transcript_110987/m.312923 type:complete len:181 (-) Transcript_110987:27-569(-)